MSNREGDERERQTDRQTDRENEIGQEGELLQLTSVTQLCKKVPAKAKNPLKH